MSYAQPTTANRSPEQARLKRTTALDRAIEAADAFIPDYLRISALDNDAQDAAYTVRLALADQKKAGTAYADQVEPRPELLKFKRDPDKQMVGMTFRFASGREATSDYKDAEFFEPESRDSLERHCEQTGLDPQPYLEAWDEWQARHERAFNGAMPSEWAAASAKEEAAADAWDAATDHLKGLIERIMKTRVKTPADVVKKIEACTRLTLAARYGTITELFDADNVIEAMVADLRRMPEPPAPAGKSHLRLVA